MMGKTLWTALACWALTSFAWAGAGMDALSGFLAQAQTAQGSFTQTLFDKKGARVEEPASGHFLFSRPGKFQWETTKPYPQNIVSNGKTLWLYDPDLQQVTVKKLSNALTGTPAAILFGQADLSASFALKELPAREGLSWVEAKPKTAGGTFAQIDLGFDSQGTIAVMELSDNFGQRTLLRFSSVKLNVAVQPSQFEFKVPEGADVFEDKTQVQ